MLRQICCADSELTARRKFLKITFQETVCRLGNRRSVVRIHAGKKHAGTALRGHIHRAPGKDHSATIDLLQKVQKAKEEAGEADERSNEAAEQAEKAAERLKAIEEEALAELQRSEELLQGGAKSLELEPHLGAPTAQQARERTRKLKCTEKTRTRNVQELIVQNHKKLSEIINVAHWHFKIEPRVTKHLEKCLMESVRPDLVWEGETLDQLLTSSMADFIALCNLRRTMTLLYDNSKGTAKTVQGSNYLKANMKILVTQAMQLLCNNTITEDIEELPT